MADWFWVLFIGGLLFLGGQGALAWGETRIDSGVAAVFYALTPAWMAILQLATPGASPIKLSSIIGMGLGFVGLFLLIDPLAALNQTSIDRLGAWVLVGSSISWAVGSALAKVRPLPGSPSLRSGAYLLGGSVALIFASASVGEWREFDPGAASLRSYLSVAYLAIVGSAVAFAAYHWLLERVQLSVLASHTFVNPIVALALGVAVGGEHLSRGTGAASASIIVGVVFILFGNKRARPKPR